MNEITAPRRNSVFLPFVLGGIVGAALGIMLAPKRGVEVRRQIRNIAADTREKISSTIGKGIDLYDDARIAVSSAIHAGRQAYNQEREKFQGH